MIGTVFRTTVSQKEQYIDEGDGDQPTAAELRLPRTLFPIWLVLNPRITLTQEHYISLDN